jgi:DNA-binding transcriptional MerR regulator
MRSAPVSVAARLRRQRMPLREIRAVLTADDPRIVRRHLELHRERLEERLAEQRALLDSLERTLSRGSVARPAGAADPWRRPPTGVGEPERLRVRSPSP